jgi:hypothetical protein
MPLTRILLYVRNVEETARFYAVLFGFEQHRTDDDRIVELVHPEGGAKLMLHPAANGQACLFGRGCIRILRGCRGPRRSLRPRPSRGRLRFRQCERSGRQLGLRVQPWCKGRLKTHAFRGRAPSKQAGPAVLPQFFSLYPVLKIHAVIDRHTTRKPSTVTRLTMGFTSAIS